LTTVNVKNPAYCKMEGREKLFHEGKVAAEGG
jgi:hypothetical protein